MRSTALGLIPSAIAGSVKGYGFKVKSKFHAKPQRADGIYFPSTGEYKRYLELKLEQSAGEIDSLNIHPRYPIVVGGTQVCLVELDFSYFKNGKWVYEDFKGVYTSESRLRHKLFEAYYGARVLITRAPARRRGRRR